MGDKKRDVYDFMLLLRNQNNETTAYLFMKKNKIILDILI